MEVVSPNSLEEALRLKAEHPEAVPIQGGTDVMVELNFDRRRPDLLLNLNEVPELRGWSRENGGLRLGSGLTYAEAMEPPLSELLPALAEASRTVGSPQIRNRGTLGGNLGTASPAGDALPPLLVEDASVELASLRSARTVPLREFLVGPKRECRIVDAGQKKGLDLEIVVPVEDMADPGAPAYPSEDGPPPTEIEPSAHVRSIWPAIYPKLLELVQEHTSTMIFVNNRRAAERLAKRLNELANGEGENELPATEHGGHDSDASPAGGAVGGTIPEVSSGMVGPLP